METASLLTVPGFEDIAAAEVRELIGAKASTASGRVTFQVKNPLDLCKLCYLSQSAGSLLLGKKAISPFNLGRRECSVYGQQGDIEGNLAYLLLRASGYNPARHFLFDPFTRSGAIAIEAAFFSSGFPVNYYRKDAILAAFPKLQHPGISKVFLATDEKSKKNKARPNVLSSSPLMQNVRYAEKNAKLAGVNKLIRFSRLDIEWLDAKLDEHSIDIVVSYPPQFNRSKNSFAAAENEKLGKMYKEFFYQAAIFMEKNGRVVLLLNGETKSALSSIASKFSHGVLRKVQLGSEPFELVKFARK